MPKYYCDYCDIYLTHDSLNARRNHQSGYKHKAQVKTHFAEVARQQAAMSYVNRTGLLQQPPPHGNGIPQIPVSMISPMQNAKM